MKKVLVVLAAMVFQQSVAMAANCIKEYEIKNQVICEGPYIKDTQNNNYLIKYSPAPYSLTPDPNVLNSVCTSIGLGEWVTSSEANYFRINKDVDLTKVQAFRGAINLGPYQTIQGFEELRIDSTIFTRIICYKKTK